MPNLIRISILMPIRFRIRIGIDTMPIHMRILPQVLHTLENLKFYLFYHGNANLQRTPPIFFLISGTGVMIFVF